MFLRLYTDPCRGLRPAAPVSISLYVLVQAGMITFIGQYAPVRLLVCDAGM